MPFVFATGVPRRVSLGAAAQPCPTCGGAQQLEERYHLVSLMLWPLFRLRARVVAVCERCGREAQPGAEALGRSSRAPVHHRFGWVVPAAALIVLPLVAIVPAQLRRQAERRLEATPGGKVVKGLMRDASGGGCGGSTPELSRLGCDAARAAERETGAGVGLCGAQVQRLGAEGLVVVAVVRCVSLNEAPSETALKLARATHGEISRAQSTAAVAVIIADGFDARAWVTSRPGGARGEESGGQVDLSPVAELVPPEAR